MMAENRLSTFPCYNRFVLRVFILEVLQRKEIKMGVNRIYFNISLAWLVFISVTCNENWHDSGLLRLYGCVVFFLEVMAACFFFFKVKQIKYKKTAIHLRLDIRRTEQVSIHNK